ncbi:TPA: hypothetical protein ACXRYE_001305 [Klebsiella quasipneumoniae subsp. quasipneumoniae]
MTKRDQYNFILHVIIPAIEQEGLTIKTRRDGEVTFLSTDPSVAEFVGNLRQSLSAALQRPVVPASVY